MAQNANVTANSTDAFAKPNQRPASPNFSSGPCKKRPGWSADALDTRVLGRSHRSKFGKERMEEVIDLSQGNGVQDLCLWVIGVWLDQEQVINRFACGDVSNGDVLWLHRPRGLCVRCAEWGHKQDEQ